MSEIKVLHISQIKPEFFVPSIPKRNARGGLRVDMEYKDPQMCGKVYLLQTPKLRVPFGMTTQEHEGGNSSYSIALSFDNYKAENCIENEFVKGIEAIDDHVKRLATENSKLWFKKAMKYEVIEELYRSSIKYSDEWPPLMKGKLPYWSGKFACEFYDNHRNKGDSALITNNCMTICLLQLTSLWFMDRQFGCYWTIKQVQQFPSVRYDAFLIEDTQNIDENVENGDNCEMLEDEDLDYR